MTHLHKTVDVVISKGFESFNHNIRSGTKKVLVLPQKFEGDRARSA